MRSIAQMTKITIGYGAKRCFRAGRGCRYNSAGARPAALPEREGRAPLLVPMKRILLLFSLLILLGCSPATPAAAPAPTRTRPPAPTATAVAGTATPQLSTAELMYPYTIKGLREHKFKSGDIKKVALIAKTKIYTSYLVSYPSDGLKIAAVMQIPAEGKPPFPVIVMNHGFFNRTDFHSGDGTDRAAEYLNKHGYITLASDYRSWGGSQAGPSLFYSGLVIDVINLMNDIPSTPQADSKRIGIWGHS